MPIDSAKTIIKNLNKQYPNAQYELNFESPFQLLIATILAAQCTDERVNKVTPGLFAKYPNAQAFADADLDDLETIVKPTGFYRKKAKTLKDVGQALVDHFGGEMPHDIDDLVTLPGVSRKTANVVLNCACRIPSGIIVDRHVTRVCQRLGLTENKNPDRIEKDLMETIPKKEWITFGPALVLHGKRVCKASKPKCSECVLDDVCPKIGVS